MRQTPTNSTPTGRARGLDLIGDVHGEYGQLVRLLEKLGYRHVRDTEAAGPGIWHHPERTAVFVGDLIDRGPDSPGVVRLVRGMVERGHALAILGNHEINAIARVTTDDAGNWLRARTPEKIGPHQTTLDQFARRPEEEWHAAIAWFKTLPLHLDFGGLRVVHASWHASSVATLAGLGPLTVENLRRLYRESALAAAREWVLNGPELPLPAGGHFFDHAGKRRTEIRTAWWQVPLARTWSDLCFPPGDVLHEVPADAPLPLSAACYGPDAPPVVFGHYALPADANAVQAPNVACVDFGAGKGGALAAYRWDGEAVLSEAKVVKVPGLSFSTHT